MELNFIIIFILIVATVNGRPRPDQDTMTIFCQRFPTNNNCANSAGATSSAPAPTPGPTSAPTPAPTPAPAPAPTPPPTPSPPTAEDCQKWQPVYKKFCIMGPVDPAHMGSCQEYQRYCVDGKGSISGSGPSLGGGGGGEGGSQGPGTPTDTDNSGTGTPSGLTGTGGTGGTDGTGEQPSDGNWWSKNTRKAQEEQAQRALVAAQNGNADCGLYGKNYNVWCAGVPINAVYCNTLGRICDEQKAEAAAGQSSMGGPFGFNSGLPTGGAGSTRPLSWGRNFGVGPFFSAGRTTAVNPLMGVGSNKGFNIPIIGLGVQQSRGADWGGLPGVAQLGAALGRRRRRWALPWTHNTYQYGNIMYRTY